MDIFRAIGTTILASGVVFAYLLIDPKSPGEKVVTTALVSAGAVGAYYLIGPSKPSGKKMGAKNSHEGVALNKREYRDFKLVKRTDVNHNTRQFRFALQTPDTVLGLPVGQHMSVKIVQEGKVIEREYTPISCDLNVGYFDLMIKVYEKGVVTQHLEHMKIGDELAFRGPRGMIVYQDPSTFFFPFSRVKNRTVSHIGMLAGGTGITPMLQILRQIERDASDSTKANLIFGNVSENDILLQDELKQVNANNENIDIQFIVDKVADGSDWPGLVGYITPDMIKEHMPAPADESLILICGPPVMQDIMKKHCETLGYAKDQVKTF